MNLYVAQVLPGVDRQCLDSSFGIVRGFRLLHRWLTLLSMAAPWDVLTPTIGAVLAALLGGALGSWLGHRSQSSQWGRNQRLNAYAELIRSYAQVYSRLSIQWTESGRSKIDWSDWNRSLAVVNMIAHESVAVQAVRIDEAMWRLSVVSARGPVSTDEWRNLREPVEGAVLGFINLARAELGGLGAALPRLTGRPKVDDPVWEEGHHQGGPGA